MPFLFGPSEAQWDHINNSEFNLAVFNVLAATIILFILPLIIKKLRYLCAAVGLTCLFALFISRFSPGFAWHGFTFGLFIFSFFIFMLIESIQLPHWRRGLFIGVSILAVALQLANNFGTYIPKQQLWFALTDEAVDLFRHRSADLHNKISASISKLDGTFCIYSDLKRYGSINPGIWIHEVAEKDKWDALKKYPNYVDSLNKCTGSPDYIVRIIPDSFMRIPEVTNGFKTNYTLQDVTAYDGYSIQTLKK